MPSLPGISQSVITTEYDWRFSSSSASNEPDAKSISQCSRNARAIPRNDTAESSTSNTENASAPDDTGKESDNEVYVLMILASNEFLF